MIKTLPRARLAAVAALSLLAACNTVGDGTYLPASIEELIPPGISAEQVYSQPSTHRSKRFSEHSTKCLSR